MKNRYFIKRCKKDPTMLMLTCEWYWQKRANTQVVAVIHEDSLDELSENIKQRLDRGEIIEMNFSVLKEEEPGT